jgi:hypothetical protein
MSLRNVGWLSADYTSLYHRRQYSPSTWQFTAQAQANSKNCDVQAYAGKTLLAWVAVKWPVAIVVYTYLTYVVLLNICFVGFFFFFCYLSGNYNELLVSENFFLTFPDAGFTTVSTKTNLFHCLLMRSFDLSYLLRFLPVSLTFLSFLPFSYFASFFSSLIP